MASEPPSEPAAAPPSFGVPLDTARRTSPWSIAYETLAVLTGLLFLISTFDNPWVAGVSLAVSFSGLVALVLRWRWRAYTVTFDQLRLDEGVLERRQRVVPFSRVQQVDITQDLLHKVVDVVSFRVETAGEGGSSTIELRVLSRPDAEALRSYVLDRAQRAQGQRQDPDQDQDQDQGQGQDQDHGSVAGSPSQGRPLYQLDDEDLALAGATHTGVLAVVVAYVVVAAPLFTVAWSGDGDSLMDGASRTVLVVGVGGLLIYMVGAAFASLSTLVSEGRWQLSEHGDDLHVRRGLLQVRSQTLPRRRVQQVTVLDNPLRRLLGRVSVVLHTAAVPGSFTEAMVRIPLVPRREVEELLASLMGPAWVIGELTPRPRRARRRAIRRRALLLAALVAVPVLWRPDVLWLLTGWVVLAWPWGRIAHRRAGLKVTDELVVFASGVLHHRVDVAPRSRLQSTRVSASPFQRRANLCTLHVDLAGTSRWGPVRLSARLFDIDQGDGEQLVRELPPRWAAPG